jgi:hypothetical protein
VRAESEQNESKCRQVSRCGQVRAECEQSVSRTRASVSRTRAESEQNESKCRQVSKCGQVRAECEQSVSRV